MEDRALVAALVAGDPRGLDGAYRRYAARLYAYSRTLLHDGEAAADVVQDTFVIAARQAGQLRDADRLAAWLYAIARNECRRHARASARHVPLEAAGDPVAEPLDPAAALQAHQVRELVHAAAAGLGDGDREVIELALRHGLAAGDMADVLGMPTNHVHARLSRARTALERAIGVLLVARAGGRDCPTLAALLVDWDGRLNPLLRKRIGRHLDGCATCSDRRSRLASPAALLAAYVAGPFAVAAGVLAEPDALRPVGHPVPVDAQTGFPKQTASLRVPTPRRRVLAAALLVLLALGAATVFVLSTGSAPAPLADRSGETPPAAPPATDSPTPGGTLSDEHGSASPAGPGDSAQPGGAGGSGDPGDPPPSRDPGGPGILGTPPPSREPAPFVLRVTRADPTCGADGATWTVTVSATGTRPIRSATLVVRAAPGAAPQRVTLRVDGSTLSGSTPPGRGPSAEWWIEATATDAATATTPARSTPTPCGRR
ncbi:sigma-70 family RNA polymerase sigma factor [Virgisporangium aurantiacum]|nr:sigma-70 family RNA polymerase sigma factor [Virgisporangium aurantiacum]